MAVAYVDSTFTGASDAQNSGQNCPVPTGAAADHIAVLVVEVWLDTSTDPIITWPTGFTQKTYYESTTDGFQRVFTAWKRLTGADSGNYTYTITNGSYWNQAQCILISGCATAGDPFEDVDTVQNSSGTSLPSASVDVTTAAFLLHVIANENNATKAPPTSFTEVEDANYLEIAYRIPGSPGTYTTSGGSTSASTLKLIVLMGLKAAGSGAIDLVVQDMSVPVTMDNIALTQQHVIAVQDAVVTTAIDQIVLTQQHLLVVQDGHLAVTMDNLTLNQAIGLELQKMNLATRMDSPSLVQAHNIVVHKMFLQTAMDTVNFASQGGLVTVSDVQKEKLEVLTASVGLKLSINDLLHKYYSGLSGLAPVAAFSATDHQRTYWKAQTGLDGSMADLEKAFYDVQLVPSGPLTDREYVYWSNL